MRFVTCDRCHKEYSVKEWVGVRFEATLTLCAGGTVDILQEASQGYDDLCKACGENIIQMLWVYLEPLPEVVRA